MRNLGGTSQRAYVTLPWGQVHLRLAGDPADPAVVLLHQSPLSSATFEPVLGLLAAQGLRVVAPDTPGFGMSDPTPQPWSIGDYADGVGHLLDALGLDEVVLLGQHTGAVVACEVARRRPRSVRGLVLQGLPLYSDEERAEKRAGYAPGYEPSIDGSHLTTIWDRVRGLYPDSDVDEVDRQVLEYLATGPDYGTAYRAVFEHTVDVEALRGVPTALVHGAQDLVHRFTDTVTAALPWAGLDVVPGTDFAAAEHPHEFATAVGARALAFHGAASGAAAGAGAAAPTVLYTASVEVVGGRGGRARSTTGSLELALARPAERGTEAGTDPEELFAAGYAACFDSALQVVARREGVRVGRSTTTASVSLVVGADQAYSIAVELEVAAPECEPAELSRLVDLAHATCPYSRATRGNIPVAVRTAPGP
ncbi:Ohr family peroxiredoxin [Nocardioides zeae]|uniref:Ohr family peroxiredoxin n=1 Tax=Nocardioides imazamoxiresistens TaxID=3231893 RepID=A0ABU3PWI6_9ACTN|nr:Ohr family peroxiredoxin [Nocardioides zeae]MDT9593598.1 Ohr family peroxiredoxin [Nocardioides zeae]